jgi:hypothetical protein
VNRTRFTVTADVVELCHGPLPLPGGWRIGPGEVRHLLVETTPLSDPDGPEAAYALVLVDNNDRRRTLAGFATWAAADRLERALDAVPGARGLIGSRRVPDRRQALKR